MFGFESTADGEIGGFNVALRIEAEDYRDRVTLVDFHDIKHSTEDREATGLKAALAIAQALDTAYRGLVERATRLGLFPQPNTSWALLDGEGVICETVHTPAQVGAFVTAMVADDLAYSVEALEA